MIEIHKLLNIIYAHLNNKLKLFISFYLVLMMNYSNSFGSELQLNLSELRSIADLTYNIKLSNSISWSKPELSFGVGYESTWEHQSILFKSFVGPEMFVDTRDVGTTFGTFLDLGVYKVMRNRNSFGVNLALHMDRNYRLNWSPVISIRFKS